MIPPNPSTADVPPSLSDPRPRSLVVVKLGGAADVDHEPALDDIAVHVAAGRRLVIVHGGSGETDRLQSDVGHPARTLRSPDGHESRHTDPRALELFVMATALVNRRLVGSLQRRGVDAFGLSGLDGALLCGQRKEAVRTVENGRVRVVRDDWSGRITGTRPGTLRLLVENGHVPVVAPVAMTADGCPLNVDGDRAAAAIAAALGASELVLLTGARGLYRAFPDPASIVESATVDEHESLLGFAQGRMKRKVIAAREALLGGAKRVVIGAAGADAPISAALAGNGTTIHAGGALAGASR